MNDLIQLKQKLIQKPNTSGGGPNKLTSDQVVVTNDLEKLKKDFQCLYDFWKEEKVIDGTLINVHYKRVVPKSKRIGHILFSNQNANSTIRGAKFNYDENGDPKHVITYFLPLENIELVINRLEQLILVMKSIFNNKISNKDIEELSDENAKKIKIISGLSKSAFLNYIIDCSNVEKVDKPYFEYKIEENQAITLYDVDVNTKDLLESLNIEFKEFSVIDPNTVILYKDGMRQLLKKAPYLISMITDDLANYKIDEELIDDPIEMERIYKITSNFPKPSNEPIVGVIDTAFDDNVYFKDWVDYRTEYLDVAIEIEEEDKKHGTAIDSIIVDGPTINPEFDDGCGRFKVRHFVVAKKGYNSTFSIMRSIEQIVKNNLDIKVWNLSLGSVHEINDNFISQEAALIDKLEYEYNIIFIIAGTNKDEEYNQVKIGAPADSINSIVVNSIKKNGDLASYTRKGKVLSFFNKPDICYYGGDVGELMRTCIGTGQYKTKGTSIAAPWITRKMAFLIYKLGLSREIAKALLIDSATGWQNINDKKAEYYGFGAVPIRIEDVLTSPKDEIKFFIEEVSLNYDTYTHSIPVPLSKNMHPYIAKATLCYFPKCSRNQGVDYTNTELDIYFGRLTEVTNRNGTRSIRIKSIVNNKQTDEDGKTLERDARKYNRKWDNVKHIVEEAKERNKAKKSYENPMWGLSIKTKDRQNPEDGKGMKFGVVITLKEINGVNRYDDFIKQCSFKGWLVNKVDIESKLDFYNKAEENIEFE